jgi:two-component system chemotaxis sensor kinase CheA
MSDSMSGGGRGNDPIGDKAREEFFSEAQELIDGLSRDLLTLDSALREGVVLRPEVINDVFRGVHTLKGLAGLFGATRMSGLSHELENILDDVRLGRLQLSPKVLDLLFQAIELYTRILAADRQGEEAPEREVETLLLALSQVSSVNSERTGGVLAQYDIDPGLLSVLTEYEEHRLRTCIQEGFALYRLHVCFALATIDTSLEDLKTNARPYGEILTYLPTGSSTNIDNIELEILMASQSPLETLHGALAGPEVTLCHRHRGGGIGPTTLRTGGSIFRGGPHVHRFQ